MHTRLIYPCFAVFSISLRTVFVGKADHVTLESSSALLVLVLAWEQNRQFAKHFPALCVIKYAVVGSASSLPSKSPRTIAEPSETRIRRGKSASAQVWVFRNCFTGEKQYVNGILA
jgi:hypothetical protein